MSNATTTAPVRGMGLDDAAQRCREAIDEMICEGASPQDDDVRMLEALCKHAENTDDGTATGYLLIASGVLCAALAIAIGLCGAVYAPMGKLEASRQLASYAVGYGVFAVGCFTAVRIKRRVRK